MRTSSGSDASLRHDAGTGSSMLPRQCGCVKRYATNLRRMGLSPDHRRQRGPTIRDVARRAGVGVGTVSRVLNGSESVSPDAHARVHRAMEQLGYRRSAIARSLSVGRAHALGVVAPFFTTPSVIERLRGVADRLAELDYNIVLFSVETRQQRADAFHDFARHDRVDGLLVISLPLTDAEIDALRHDDLPVVMIDVAHPRVVHVGIDDVHGGELAARHLLAKGHTRIGFVGDTTDNVFGFTSSERRLKGFRRALREAGVERVPAQKKRGVYGREA